MAEFGCVGLDGLMLSLQEIMEIPEDVQDEMLNAQADVVVSAQRAKVKAYGIYDGSSPVHVASSIKKGRVKLKKGTRVLYVSPTGTRTRGKDKKQKTRNAEIMFVNEFGKSGQKALPAIADANEACAEETTQAAFRVYDEWLKSKDL